MMSGETYHGVVKGVHVEVLGDAIATAASIGATSIVVYDVADFDEEGGYLRLNGTVLEYLSWDDDTSTIKLAVPLVAAASVDDKVDVWDKVNNVPATLHKAVVDQIDGFEGFTTVTVSQGVAHALSQDMRDGTGESVTLAREGAELRIQEVHGRSFSLAALQYLQGGMTTRLAEDESGVDIVGSESGTPGIYAFKPGGSPSVIIDATTGNASFIGEIGTALPGQIGIFAYTTTFQQMADVTVSRPVLLFNVGSNRDQASIQSDTDPGSGSPSLYLFSGATIGGRETRTIVRQGSFQVGIESVANDQTYLGAQMRLERDWFNVETDDVFDTSNPNDTHAKVQFDNIAVYTGYQNSVNGNLRGFQYILQTGFDQARVLTLNAFEIKNPTAGSFKPINASAFNVSSDGRPKTARTPVAGALAAIEALTVYDYDTPHGTPAADQATVRARGVIAQDVAKVAPIAVVEMSDGIQGVDVYALLATTVAAVQELSSEVNDLRTRLPRNEK